MSINENKRKCDRCEFIKEECWLAQHSDGKWYCGICQGDIYYEKERVKIDEWAKKVNDSITDDAVHDYLTTEGIKYKQRWHCWGCGAKKQAVGDNPYCGECYEKQNNQFPYSKCDKCEQEIKNMEGLCPCIQKEVTGFKSSAKTEKSCEDCGYPMLSNTCERCITSFVKNIRPEEANEVVPTDIANDYTFNFCPWCKQDMILKCNEDWTLRSGAISERRLHLDKCSEAPQEVRDRIKKDMGTDSKIIAEQIKKGSFRKNGNNVDGIEQGQNTQNNSSKNALNKGGGFLPFPMWYVLLPILFIGILVGWFLLWRWWRRWKARDIVNAIDYFKCQKCQKSFYKTYQTQKDVCNGCFEPPVKEVVEKQPIFKKRQVFNKNYQKNYQTAKQTDWNNASTKTSYFTCGKCSLVYKGNMEGSNGNCLKCE